MNVIKSIVLLAVFAMVEINHPFTAYAGQRPIGKLERLCYERHELDLKDGGARGLWFDEQAAELYAGFFPKYLKFVEGTNFAGKPFILSPYQDFIVRSLMGWMRLPKGMTLQEAARIGSKEKSLRAAVNKRKAAGIFRRYSKSFVEIARKGGKSPFAAGFALMFLSYDGEAGAQCYAAGVSRSQARIVWGHAREMVKRSPDLKKRIDVTNTGLFIPATFSSFLPMSREAKNEEGKNIHFVSFDEVHRHPNRELFEAINEAFISRQQPLMFQITTAGDGRPGTLWFQQHEYARQTLESAVKRDKSHDDDAYFAYIANPDEGDDYRLESTWMKAQPNYGISARADKVAEQCHAAENDPALLSSFMRFQLNIPTITVNRWAAANSWGACGGWKFDPEEMKGRACYVGIDLSRTTDLTSINLLFPPTEGDTLWRTVGYGFVPSERIENRVKKDKVHYDVWVLEGFLTATEGDVVDYAVVMDKVDWACKQFDVLEIAIDPWNATPFNTSLMEAGHDNIVAVRQGPISLSGGMKELERLIFQKKIRHNDNPVFAWCMSNLVVRMDVNENIAPSKGKSTERIDFVSAMVTAASRAFIKDEGVQVYDGPGFIAL